MKESNFTHSVFVFCPGGISYNYDFSNYSGSAYIIAYLRENGFSASQYVSNPVKSLSQCLNEIAAFKPRIVGFTVFNENFLQCASISREIKKHTPGTLVIWGGPTCTMHAGYIVENYPFVDVCVRREGEETMLKLVQALDNKNYRLPGVDLDSIHGISFLRDGKVVENPDSNILVKNREIKNYLDRYPSPYLNGVIPPSDGPKVGVVSSRGCNQLCIYCNSTHLYNHRIYTHSVDRVVAEMDFLAKNRVDDTPIHVGDDNFTALTARAKTICKTMLENKIHIPWSCVTRCDCLDEELLDLLRATGLTSIKFSLESAVPRVLRAIGKVHAPEDVPSDNLEKEYNYIDRLKKMTAYAKKIGIESVVVHAMGGLPTETAEEIQQTFDLVNRLDIDLAIFNSLIIFAHTPVHSKYRQYGYRLETMNDNPILSKTIHTDPAVNEKLKTFAAAQNEFYEHMDNHENLRILSLSPQRTEISGYFDHMILTPGTVIDTEMADWLVYNLAINGKILHLFTDRDMMEKSYNPAMSVLYKSLSPSTRYTAYYIDPDGGYRGENADMVIPTYPTREVLSDAGSRIQKTYGSLSTESDPGDPRALYRFLCNLSAGPDSFQHLISNRPYPYFQNLCRWTSGWANCRVLETVIVDPGYNLRLCWFGEPVGKVGMTTAEIARRFNEIREEKRQRSGCVECPANGRCIACPFPHPLEDSEYCRCQEDFDVSPYAEQVGSFDVFKEFFAQKEYIGRTNTKLFIPKSSFNCQ